MYPENRECVTKLCKLVRAKFPGKTIWLYTGYTYDEIRDLEIMDYIDVLVDGRYEADLRDVKLHWVGSSNQRVIDLHAGKDIEISAKENIYSPDIDNPGCGCGE